MKNTKISRRKFLAATTTATAFTILPRHVLGRSPATAPSEKLNIAGIGLGMQGIANLVALEGENIVALCDVDHEYAAKAFQKYPGARIYRDYRKMLDAQQEIDAVVIATPDHTHAVIAMAAIQSGKHVYCQKPLTRTVGEARRLAEAARNSRVVTQTGIQGHSGEGPRLICEWLAAGAIGEVREVDAWCNISYYPWGHEWWSSKWSTRPQDTPSVPDTLDWDLWLGPAPWRPYHPAYHPLVWRSWWDFGSSMMGDRGVHTLDPVIWALDLGAPTSVEATSLGGTDDIHCLAAIVTYRFPARGDKPPVKLTWYEGVRAPRPEELEPGRQMGESEGGIIFNGSTGKLMCGLCGNSPRLIPESRMVDFKRPEKRLPRVPDSHEMDWVRACKSGQPACADFVYGGLVTEICQLGNVAKRVDGRIEWDAAQLKVTNLPEANQYVQPPYRAGWSL